MPIILPALMMFLLAGTGTQDAKPKPGDPAKAKAPASDATKAKTPGDAAKPKVPLGDAVKVEVITSSGAKFTGLVDAATASKWIKDDALVNPRTLPATAKLELLAVNGLSGKMTVTMRDVTSWKLVARVAAGQVNAGRQSNDDARRARLDEEDKRLEQERVKREERKAATAKKEGDDKAKQNAADQVAKLAAAERLLSRFPPELGWGPDRKAEIERRRIVLGLNPSDEEKEFLDSFEAWTNALSLREEHQAKLKQELEKKGEAGDKDMPKKSPPDEPKPADKGSGSHG